MTHLNDITPGDIFKVSNETYAVLNKLVKGQMTSICFARKEGNSMLLKPATRRDLKLVIQMFDMTKLPFEKVIESTGGEIQVTP